MLAAMKVIFLVALCQLALVKARTPPRASTKRPQTPHLPPTTNIPRTIRIFTNSPPTSTADPSSTDLCATANCSDVCDVINGKAVCSCNEKESKLDSDGLSCVTLSPCELAHCSDVCRVVKNKAVCSCSDDRLKLDKNGYTCVPKRCKSKRWWKTKGDVDCGKGICKTKLDSKFSLQLPYCSCEVRGAQYDSATKDCVLVKSCANNNSGCSDGCAQLDANDYYCYCPKGFRLNADMKTCRDVDECAGFHGCDQKCIDDGNHYYKCGCNDGFELQADGYSCRLSLDPCELAHCSDVCHVVKNKAVCLCSDDRFKLNKNGYTCVPKRCPVRDILTRKMIGGDVDCGEGVCSTNWVPKFQKLLPYCYCKRRGERYDSVTKKCNRGKKYVTCDWPNKKDCDQKCTVILTNKGSYPKCECDKDGYSLKRDNKTCTITDQCKAGRQNGGCEQSCKHLAPGKVQCSCGSHFTLDKQTEKKCLVKNCANGNTGCSHGCSQLEANDYYCYCPKGFRLNADMKTCRDVDECAGFHGCDQKCIDDGNHFYKCGCNDGFELQADGYSCRQEDKCLNSPCEQFCNSHDGSCYCDHHRVPDNRDPTKCVDRDECADGSAGCSELCENHDGGFSCKCFNSQARLSDDLKTCYMNCPQGTC